MAALGQLFARLQKRLYNREDRYLYMAPDPRTLGDTPPLQGLRNVRVDASNGELIDTWDGIRDSFRNEFREMLTAGEVGLFVLDGNTVASHLWVQVNGGPGVIRRGYLKLYPGEAYAHFAHTYRAYRRRNLAHLLASQLIQMQDEFAAKGIRTIKTSVLVTNTASLALLRSVGTEILGRSTQWTILGLNLYRVTLNEAGKALSDVRW